MENNRKHINDLKCIKLIHTYDNKKRTLMINYNKFYTSFVDERWRGERRTNKKHTIFGYWHTKTTVPNPYSNEKSVRVFKFPTSEAQARELDYNYCKEIERGEQ